MGKPYQWMSAACIRQFVDGAVIIFDSDRFEVLQLFGDTTSPSNVTEVQYDFQNSKGNNCVAANISAAGERAFVGARMREKFTKIDFCLFGGDFPHPERKHKWTREFSQIVKDCYQRFAFLGDTNLGIPSPCNGLEALELFPEHKNLHCSDPGTGYDTCCLDKDSYAPRYRSDRIITCSNTANRGVVSNFKVEPRYICDSQEEHRFITAHVTLYPSPTSVLY